MSLFPSFSTSGGSVFNIGPVGKDEARTANKAKIQKPMISTRTTFPTTAAGTDPTPPIPDPFRVTADFYRAGKYYEGENSGYEIPPRQFIPFDSKTPSSIRIWGKPENSDIQKDIIPAYTKFILENVQESHTERSQIIETFGDFYVFMFGERPPVYNFSGQLVNSVSASWVTDFMFMYHKYFRGTQCTLMNATALVTYGGRQVEGLVLNATTGTNASMEGAVQFSFSVVVFERKFFNFSPDLGFFTTGGMEKELFANSAFTELLDKISGAEGRDTSTLAFSNTNKTVEDQMNGKKPFVTFFKGKE